MTTHEGKRRLWANEEPPVLAPLGEADTDPLHEVGLAAAARRAEDAAGTENDVGPRSHLAARSIFAKPGPRDVIRVTEVAREIVLRLEPPAPVAGVAPRDRASDDVALRLEVDGGGDVDGDLRRGAAGGDRPGAQPAASRQRAGSSAIWFSSMAIPPLCNARSVVGSGHPSGRSLPGPTSPTSRHRDVPREVRAPSFQNAYLYS